MIVFVLDASIILASLLSENNDTADVIVSRHLAAGSIAYVPSLWHLEIRNILWHKEKKGLIPKGGMVLALGILERFSIITDHVAGRPDAMKILEQLMQNHGLTSYDASYIELALRLNLPIATLDGDMIRVARELDCLLDIERRD